MPKLIRKGPPVIEREVPKPGSRDFSRDRWHAVHHFEDQSRNFEYLTHYVAGPKEGAQAKRMKAPPYQQWQKRVIKTFPQNPTERDWHRFELKKAAIERRYQEWHVEHTVVSFWMGMEPVIRKFLGDDEWILITENIADISKDTKDALLNRLQLALFSDASDLYESRLAGSGPIPMSRHEDLKDLLKKLGVFFANGSEPLDPIVIQVFCEEVKKWGETEYSILSAIYYQSRLSRHEIVGMPPSVNEFLRSQTEGLRQNRQSLGIEAATNFYSEAISSYAGIRAENGQLTDFSLSMSAGKNEALGGVCLSIFEQSKPPFLRGGEMFRLEFVLGEDQTLRIVTLQGVNKHLPIQYNSDWDRKHQNPMHVKLIERENAIWESFEGADETEYDRLRTTDSYKASLFSMGKAVQKQREDFAAQFGGLSPQDFLYVQLLKMAKAWGIKRIEGVRDSAQMARQDEVLKGKASPAFYDLIFKRWDMESPEPEGSYWSMPMPDDLEDYLAKILIRSNRPKDWKKQEPNPDSAQMAYVRAWPDDFAADFQWVDQRRVTRDYYDQWKMVPDMEEKTRSFFTRPLATP